MSNIKLISKLNEAKEAYYNGNALMTDEEFDNLEGELKEKDPLNNYFNTVGFITNGKNKVQHNIPMKSMNKEKTPEEIEKWMQSLGNYEYLYMPKVDGVSCTIKYIDGKISYIATRGDGKIGMNITHIKDYVLGVPEELKESLEIEIRGEIYLPVNTEYDTKGKSLRNNAAGILNRKSNQEDLSYLHFIGYDVINKDKFQTHQDKIHFLKTNNFDSIYYELINYSQIQEVYNNYLNKLRNDWSYETDGLVIIVNDLGKHDEINDRYKENDHHNFYNIALKPPSLGKETILKEIIWQMSRQGNLIPVALFTPVNIGGSTIQRATLNNASHVKELKLYIDDKIYVEKANDVIPYIKENRSKHTSSNLIIESCPYCLEKLKSSGVHIQCSNDQCPEILIQRIIYWVKEAKMDNIAEGYIRLLFENKIIKEPLDLYKLQENDLVGIKGISTKKINSLLKAIKKDLRITFPSLLSRMNIPIVRKKALNKLNILTHMDFLHFKDDSSVIGNNLITWREKSSNKVLMERALSIFNITQEDIKIIGVKGNICATGKSVYKRKDLIEMIESFGYVWSSSVNKDLNILLTDDVNSNSSKVMKAKKNKDIQIITYEEFFNANHS